MWRSAGAGGQSPPSLFVAAPEELWGALVASCPPSTPSVWGFTGLVLSQSVSQKHVNTYKTEAHEVLSRWILEQRNPVQDLKSNCKTSEALLAFLKYYEGAPGP